MLLVLAACTQFFGANVQNQLALMVNNVFETGADAFGWAAACLAVGSLAGALLAARRERPHLRLVLLGAMVFGMLQALAGFMPSYLAFVVVLVPMGVAFMTFVTTLNATFQLSVDPQMRGRVMSMFLLVFMGVAPLGAPVVGFLADAFGPGTSMFIGGSVTVVVVAALTLALRWAKGITLRELFVQARIDEGRPPERPEPTEEAEESEGSDRCTQSEGTTADRVPEQGEREEEGRVRP
mgnify:CR=1 FL=1